MGGIVSKCQATDISRAVAAGANRRESAMRSAASAPKNPAAPKPPQTSSDTDARGAHPKGKTPTAAEIPIAAAQTTKPTKDELERKEGRVQKRVPASPATTTPPSAPLPSVSIPLSSCLVESKYTADRGRSIPLKCDQPKGGNEKGTQLQSVHIPPTANSAPLSCDDMFEIQSDVSNGFGNDVSPTSNSLRNENNKLTSDNLTSSAATKNTPFSNSTDVPRDAISLMECSFDSNVSLRDERSGSRRGSGSSGTGGGSKTSVSPFLPFLVSHPGDERSAKSLVDYITGHALFLRKPRDVTWFNVDFKRSQLQRRKRAALISWNPLEMIAYNDLEDSSLEGEETPQNSSSSTTETPLVASVAVALAASTTNATSANTNATETLNSSKGQPQRQRKKSKDEEETASTVRSRRRPIIAIGVPHHLQLAKKALEDNVIFIHSRAPKFF